ncbi:MAG: TetR/AcrR family transcriptional regulator [Clostridia bacterium]|nr:TetR/AcrR family transcriptional regulator [Clostridia bacterium]MBQ7113349.1 TetR/AcrR family transcriptional regulator [Clostridia bacterium]
MRKTFEGYGSVQEAILGIASQLFTETGVHGTSLQDIAKAAGLSKGTLYYYYPTKEALVNDIAAAHAARITDLLLTWIETISRGCPMEDALEILIGALLDDQALRKLHVVLFTESCLAGPSLSVLMEEMLRKWTVMLEVGTLKVQSDSARRLRDRSSLFFTLLTGAMMRPHVPEEERQRFISVLLSESV